MTETRGEDCGATTILVDAGAARVDADGRRGCAGEPQGDFVDVVVTEPQGRLYVVWERQEGDQAYSDLAVAHPPRVFEWHEDEYGCWIAVSGLPSTSDCPAGGPPPPPAVPWGRVLP